MPGRMGVYGALSIFFCLYEDCLEIDETVKT